ncbi:MAG: bifunctional oligoribonuclease/PAP phosphatase NrnA [Firmicutes bacterium]|nr:bifunctional oligoribonuclease/PAP phosphatase NrnA [Bacillota bacterium]
MSDLKDKAFKLKDLIDSANSIALSSHVSVDGDNLGSSLALYIALKNMGKEVIVYKSDEIPNAYNFLPSVDEFAIWNDLVSHDLYISLDCGDIERLGKNKELFTIAKNKVVIDHHKTNPGYGDLNIIEFEKSSTCELLFELFMLMDFNITPNMATALFSGISTDTGRFLYSNTSPRTFEIAKILLEYGADKDTAYLNLFMNRPRRKLEVLKIGLEKAEFIDDFLAISTILKEDLKSSGASIHELDEIGDFLRDTEGIEVAALIKEADDGIYKISLRSKEYLNVGSVAYDLGGGGHIKAAGATMKGNLDEVKEKLINRILNERN